jgi:hypothetical protein
MTILLALDSLRRRKENFRGISRQNSTYFILAEKKQNSKGLTPYRGEKICRIPTFTITTGPE